MPGPDQHRRVRLAIALGGVLLIALALVNARAEESSHSKAAQSRDAIRNLPSDVVPLYVIGDLNGDNVVDGDDERLLEDLIAAIAKGSKPPARVTCVAAGDLDQDARVTGKDLAILRGWLHSGGGVAIPALHWQPSLDCTYPHPLFASQADTTANRTVPILFIDPEFTIHNCKAVVSSGPASVAPRLDGKGFDVKVSSRARDGDRVSIVLLVPPKRAFVYTIPVATPPAPPQRRPY